VRGDGLHIRNLMVRNSGDVYAVTGDELWLIRATGEKIILDEGLKGASGVALSPDGLWLFVAQGRSRNGLSYRVRPDGTVDARAPFYDFVVGNRADDSGAAGIGMDRDGRAYVARAWACRFSTVMGAWRGLSPYPGMSRRPAFVSVVMISMRSTLPVAGRCIGESFPA
jgi:gluconolactonase